MNKIKKSHIYGFGTGLFIVFAYLLLTKYVLSFEFQSSLFGNILGIVSGAPLIVFTTVLFAKISTIFGCDFIKTDDGFFCQILPSLGFILGIFLVSSLYAFLGGIMGTFTKKSKG